MSDIIKVDLPYKGASSATVDSPELPPIGSIPEPIGGITPTPDYTVLIQDIAALKQGDSGDGWSFNDGVLNITGDGVFRIEGTGTATTNRIWVNSGVATDIILNNVNINATNGAALDMNGQKVTLWLEGTSDLSSTNKNISPGIRTVDGDLTIEGVGTINVKGSAHAPGIGGAGHPDQLPGGVDGPGENGGSITVNYGIVNLTGGEGAAGIGGGCPTGSQQYDAGDGANLTVNGGKVTASGNPIAIGGARYGKLESGNGGTIFVNGGILVATGNVGGVNVAGSENSGGRGADVTVASGLFQVSGSFGGSGGNNGTTSVTGGNLSISNPGTNIKGDAKDTAGNKLFAVQIYLYDPDGRQFKFDPGMYVQYTLDGKTIDAIADSNGDIFMYLPAGSKGSIGTMTADGKTYAGELAIENNDHRDYLTFAPPGVVAPNPPNENRVTLINDPNLGYTALTAVNGNTITNYKVTTVLPGDANYISRYEPGNDEMYFLPETGELVFGRGIAQEMSTTAADGFSLDYNVKKLYKGELNPVVYFDCMDKSSKDSTEHKTYSMDNQQGLDFEFGMSSQVQVNSLAKDVYTANLYAELVNFTDMVSQVEFSSEESLRAKFDNGTRSDAEIQRLIDEQLSSERQKFNGYLHTAFNAIMEQHDMRQQQTINEYADLGARMNRIELISSRLDQDIVSYSKILSQNEDVDYSELLSSLSSMEAIYNASLSIGAKLSTATLADYL